MSSSETMRTTGAPQPEKTVNSVWTCSFHRFAQSCLDLRLSMDDMPGFALDETAFSPRVRLAVDSARPTIDSISLNGVPQGSPLSIGDASNLEVILITNDENGFDTGEAAVLHYRVKQAKLKFLEAACSCRTLRPLASNILERVPRPNRFRCDDLVAFLCR